MKKYEGLFIFPPEVTSDSAKDSTAEVTKWIEKFQGKVLQANDLGKKSLGHLIGKYREGRTFVFEYEMPASQTQAFRKDLELQEGLLKYMITFPSGKPTLPPVTVAVDDLAEEQE